MDAIRAIVMTLGGDLSCCHPCVVNSCLLSGSLSFFGGQEEEEEEAVLKHKPWNNFNDGIIGRMRLGANGRNTEHKGAVL